jgi:hypothetical protein
VDNHWHSAVIHANHRPFGQMHHTTFTSRSDSMPGNQLDCEVPNLRFDSDSSSWQISDYGPRG